MYQNKVWDLYKIISFSDFTIYRYVWVKLPFCALFTKLTFVQQKIERNVKKKKKICV